MPHLRVELNDVHCDDTEEVLGTDDFYLIGGIVVGAGKDLVTKGILIRPIPINTGETRHFAAEEAVLFDGDVSADAGLHLGLSAFDEDSAKDWSKYAQAQQQLTNSISGYITEIEDAGAPVATQLIPNAIATTATALGPIDADDRLGDLAFDAPVSTFRAEDGRTWNLSSLGWYSSWDYTVRYTLAYAP